MHLIENPSCACGHPVEDFGHLFLRIELVINGVLISRATTAVLLYGNTKLGIGEVYTFIRLSCKFD